MPIIKRTPRRKGQEKLVYFKGSLAEARKVKESQLKETFSEAGFPLTNPDKALAGLKSVAQIAESEKGKAHFLGVKVKGGIIFLSVKASPKGRILIKQHPLTHGVRGRQALDSFEVLQLILKGGFKRQAPAGYIQTSPANVVRYEKHSMGDPKSSEGLRERITDHDEYAIELMAPGSHLSVYSSAKPEKKEDYYDRTKPPTSLPSLFIEKAEAKQIIGINIFIPPFVDADLREKKKQFYRNKLKGWHVRFI